MAMLDEAEAAFNKVVQAVEMKKVKLDDLISTEERYRVDCFVSVIKMRILFFVVTWKTWVKLLFIMKKQ